MQGGAHAEETGRKRMETGGERRDRKEGMGDRVEEKKRRSTKGKGGTEMRRR
jgi:hypothetical protein